MNRTSLKYLIPLVALSTLLALTGIPVFECMFAVIIFMLIGVALPYGVLALFPAIDGVIDYFYRAW